MSKPETASIEASTTVTLLPSPGDSIFLGSEGLRAGWGILFFILLFLAVGQASKFFAAKTLDLSTEPRLRSSLLPPAEITAKYLYASEGLSLVAVLLATFALARIEGRPFATYGLSGTRRLRHFAMGLLWGILCLSLLFAALHLTGHLSLDARLLPTRLALRYGVIWAVGFTLVALLEETLLRGYLQYTLSRGLRAVFSAFSNNPAIDAFAFWASALVLSCVFGLGHGSNPGESPLGLLAAGLAGLVFSLALYRTGSLWWAIGFHASWDWAQSFLYGVPDSGNLIQHHFLATHAVGLAILSGGSTGPEGSIFILPTLAFAAAIIVLTLPQTPYSNRP